MSDDKKSMGLAGLIIPAVIAAISAIAAAFITSQFSYQAGVDAVLIPLHATQTYESRPGQAATVTMAPANVNAKVLSMDSLPFGVFPYGAGKDLSAPKYFSYFYVDNNGNSEKEYKLDFSLPLQGDAYAGISFQFSESLNLKDYGYIDLTMAFGEEETRCDLFMRDISMQPDGPAPFVTLGGTVNPDIEASSKDNKWHYRIPLQTYFKTVNLNAVNVIGLNAWRFEGKHTFSVSEIKFVKP